MIAPVHPDYTQTDPHEPYTPPHARVVIDPARNLQDIVCDLLRRVEALEVWKQEYERRCEGDGK